MSFQAARALLQCVLAQADAPASRHEAAQRHLARLALDPDALDVAARQLPGTLSMTAVLAMLPGCYG